MEVGGIEPPSDQESLQRLRVYAYFKDSPLRLPHVRATSGASFLLDLTPPPGNPD